MAPGVETFKLTFQLLPATIYLIDLHKSIVRPELLNLLAFQCYRYAIVRDMTAAGLGLNKFCYAGLITAHKNKMPSTDDTATKVYLKYFYFHLRS